MLYLNQTYEVLTGGTYWGNPSWNKKHSEVDNCFKLYHLMEGEVFVCDEKQTFNLLKGHLYFINGSKLASQYCQHSFSTHWLHFIPKDLIIHQALLSLPTILELPAEAINLPDAMPRLQNLLGAVTISSWGYALNVLNVQTLLQAVILELFKQCDVDFHSISFEVLRIEPAMRYMNQHYKETVKLEQLAEQCCMSPNYFHKIFKKALNTTPANYLVLLRMNAALRLLTDKQQTIKGIAYELGFSDNAHFCRTFKKYYGIAPGEYQKKKGDILL